MWVKLVFELFWESSKEAAIFRVSKVFSDIDFSEMMVNMFVKSFVFKPLRVNFAALSSKYCYNLML